MDAGPINARPISIAVLALGGEGGGVLADWIVGLAEHGGYLSQATSVPGVAQRTGATVYYVELFPKAATAGRQPVLALMPVPGDVDIVIASEFMEAGRAVQRGLVTPDRTTLITSTHRVYAMTEKIALADARVDDAALLDACRAAARRLVAFDMEGIAEATGSVISAVLFGALAGSGALPFPRAAFEAAIRRGGVGVAASLAAFAAGFEAATSGSAPPTEPVASPGETASIPSMLHELEGPLSEAGRAVLHAGIARLVDYQDAAYAGTYLEKLRPVLELERRHGISQDRLLTETARQLALAMAYEDTIRVAELKIRPNRFARVRQEVGIADSQILEIAEFMHPRTQEIADTLPASLGGWLLRTGWARRLVDRVTRSGRVVKTTSLRGFLLLYAIAAMKPLRRRSLRFAHEQSRITNWLDAVMRTADIDHPLAIEVARARNLVKGYGDTHACGTAKFEAIMLVVPRLVGTPDGAAALAALHRAALQDESGAMLDQAIRDLSSGSAPGSPPGNETAANSIARTVI